jgi:transposase
MLHVGVDLHKSYAQVAVIEESGELKEFRVPTEAERVEEVFGALARPAYVAVEAQRSWYWFVDLLQRLGHEVVLSNPKQTKAIASARLKNDRVDACMLASLAKGDLLPTVWIPPPALREQKELLRHRWRLVRMRTSLKNALHALLAKHNLRPPGRRLFTQQGLRWLSQVPLAEGAGWMRNDGLSVLALLDEQITQLDQEVRSRGEQSEVVRLLTTLPGVGWLTALTVVSEVGEIERFPTSKHLCSYAGLVPRVRASGGRAHHGRITKEGPRMLRWILVEAASSAVRRPGPLQRHFRKLSAKRGRSVAKVAVARKMLGVIYHMWQEGITYSEFLERDGLVG